MSQSTWEAKEREVGGESRWKVRGARVQRFGGSFEEVSRRASHILLGEHRADVLVLAAVEFGLALRRNQKEIRRNKRNQRASEGIRGHQRTSEGMPRTRKNPKGSEGMRWDEKG